jgi:dihydroorotate dehydrogenase (fumarate)
MENKVNLAGIWFNHPVIMNGAGTCKTKEEAEILLKSPLAIDMVGSITILQSEGNYGETFWADPDGRLSLNSIGLRNMGMPYYKQHLPEIADLAHQANKILAVSVAGFSPEEYAILTKFAVEKGADLVELDLGCGNIWESGVQKRIACFDPLLVKEIIEAVEKTVGPEARVVAKLSPFSDPFLLAEVAGVISQFKVVKAVTSTNTFPNAFLFNEKKQPRITSGGGLAALGGPTIKPIALGQVKQLRSLLPKRIDVIGAGGINDWEDILDFYLVDAKAVQICTFLLKFAPRDWPEVIARLLIRYRIGLEKRGLLS